MSWKVWIFKEREEFELPCGCVGVWRKVEEEPGVREFVVCCPRRISERQASVVFQGAKELRHTKGKGPRWETMRLLYLQMDFEECAHRPGLFYPPVIPPGRPRSSKVKEKDPGPAFKFHNVIFQYP